MVCDDSGLALKVLSLVPTISNALLRLHRTEALLALHTLQTFLENNSESSTPAGRNNSPPTACSQRSISSIRQLSAPPSTPPSTPPPTSPFTPLSSSNYESAPNPKSTVELIKALDKDIAAIKEFLSKSEAIATNDELNRVDEDPRVVDLQLSKGPSSQTTKFRRVLGERSLASEFTEWELQKHGTSRVKELLAEHYDLSQKKNGNIARFLESNKQNIDS